MPSSSSLDEKSVLLRISNTSELIKSHLRSHPSFKGNSRVLTQPLSRPDGVVDLVLPYPQEIVDNVRNSGVPVPIQDRIVPKIEQWYQDVRRTIQGEYVNTLNQLVAAPPLPGAPLDMGLSAFYESFFKQKVLKLNTEIELKLRVVASSIRAAAQNAKGRTPFNHECLPLLETYFEHNAYPSALDRAMLARKTKMCPRQIEVWFQNHRRRAKKEGRRLRRLSQDPLPHGLLKSSMAPSPLVPESDSKVHVLKVQSPGPKEEISQSPAPTRFAADALYAPPPAHVFPTKYRPAHDHSPCLLTDKRWSFPPPIWPRQVPVKTSPLKATITPNELAVELQKKLSITGSDAVKHSDTASTTWYPIITVPLAAPHFALVRTPSPPSGPQPQPIVRDPTPQSLRQKTSSLTNCKRPSPYSLRQPLKHRSLGRTSSNSSLGSMSSSSDESEIRTPSPSPLARYVSLPKDAYIPPQYPDWEAYLLPP